MSDDKPTLDLGILTEADLLNIETARRLKHGDSPGDYEIAVMVLLRIIDALLTEHLRLTAALDEAQRVTRIEYNNEGMATPLDIPPGATITKIDMTWNVEDTPDAGEGSDE